MRSPARFGKPSTSGRHVVRKYSSGNGHVGVQPETNIKLTRCKQRNLMAPNWSAVTLTKTDIILDHSQKAENYAQELEATKAPNKNRKRLQPLGWEV